MMSAYPDRKIQAIALWYIDRPSMDIASWQWTILGRVHEAVAKLVGLEPGELPIVSSYVSEESWYLLTSRRILGRYAGKQVSAVPLEVVSDDFGNFKGYRHVLKEEMVLHLVGGDEVRLEYETGYASMAPIYYSRFWKIKYPFLDKLVDDPRVSAR
jgi:hypothetical protein